MTTRRRRSPTAITHSIQLAVAAPQVAARRLARLAHSRGALSARGQRQLAALSLEKAVAFQQSWFAMGLEVARLQQSAWLALWQSAWAPWTAAAWKPAARTDWQRAALAIAGAGIRPIRNKAVANARNLRRRR